MLPELVHIIVKAAGFTLQDAGKTSFTGEEMKVR
jgi:hypothetical protein